jgi:hypothetical protein
MTRIWRIIADKSQKRSARIRYIRVIRVPLNECLLRPSAQASCIRK